MNEHELHTALHRAEMQYYTPTRMITSKKIYDAIQRDYMTNKVFPIMNWWIAPRTTKFVNWYKRTKRLNKIRWGAFKNPDQYYEDY
jgi:hypothetical protein